MRAASIRSRTNSTVNRSISDWISWDRNHGIGGAARPSGSIRKFLAEDTKNFDPRKFLAASTKAMKEICKARYEAFGSAGQAAKIKPISLDDMAIRYSKGELNAVIK